MQSHIRHRTCNVKYGDSKRDYRDVIGVQQLERTQHDPTKQQQQKTLTPIKKLTKILKHSFEWNDNDQGL